MLNLHYAPHTISVAVAIALEEVGTPYVPILVDFREAEQTKACLLYTSPSPRDKRQSRMPSSA